MLATDDMGHIEEAAQVIDRALSRRGDPLANYRFAANNAATQLIGSALFGYQDAITALRELDHQYLDAAIADIVATILTVHDIGERVDLAIIQPLLVESGSLAVINAAIDAYSGSPTTPLLVYRAAVTAIERYRLAQQAKDAALNPARWAEWLARCQEHAPQSGITTVDWADWRVQAAQPARWLIREWLLAGTVTVLAAAGGTGKSNLALGLALSTVTGTPIFPALSPERGTVLYLDLENNQATNLRRIAAYAERHLAAQNGMLDMALEGLHLHVGRGQFVESTARNLTTTPYFAEVLRLVETVRPSLVVIDHLRRIAGGAEQNSNEAMGAVMETCDRLARAGAGAAVLLLAHQPKAALQPGVRPSQANVRGASSIVDEARCVWELRRESEVLLLNRVKCNEAALTTEPLAFRFQAAAQSVCLHQSSTPPELMPARSPDIDACVLDWLRGNPDNTVTARNAQNGTGDGGQLVEAVRGRLPSVRPLDVANSLQRLCNRGVIRIAVRMNNRHRKQGYDEAHSSQPVQDESAYQDDCPF